MKQRAQRPLGRHAGGGLVAEGGAEGSGVARVLEIGAVGAAAGHGRDLGHRLDQGPVGADLQPHGGGKGGHQLLLGGVPGPVAAAQIAQMLGPLGLALLGQEAERSAHAGRA